MKIDHEILNNNNNNNFRGIKISIEDSVRKIKALLILFLSFTFSIMCPQITNNYALRNLKNRMENTVKIFPSCL